MSSIGFSQVFSLKINHLNTSICDNYYIKVAVTAHKSGSMDLGFPASRDPTTIAKGSNHTFSYTFPSGYTVDYSTLVVTAELSGVTGCTTSNYPKVQCFSIN